MAAIFRSSRAKKAPFVRFKDRRLSLELNFPTVGIIFTNLVKLTMYVATTTFRKNLVKLNVNKPWKIMTKFWGKE